MPLTVASWNVNSLKVRLPQVLDWLQSSGTDILGLQELKMPTEAVPIDAFRELGLHCVASGQKTYNGVALISREQPRDVVTEIPGFEDPQRRVMAATIGNVRVIDLYVVNGEAVGSDKFAYKLQWLDALHGWVASEMIAHEQVIVMGDFNIAPDDRDVHDPQAWAGKVLCSDDERSRLQRLINLGLVDTFRLFEQPEQTFSWWDYRAAGFRRNRGLRIDLVLASKALADRCAQAWIDREPRGWERPSDHAPVVARFAD
ncbi:MAG: exodeoxyribonuclease III [Halothiobacillaceae bacterium]